MAAEKTKQKGLKAATFTTSEAYIDSHCHLDLALERAGRGVSDLPAEVLAAEGGGVFGPGFAGAVNVCCAPEGLATCDAVARLRLPQIRCAWGVHPHDAVRWTPALGRAIAERVADGCGAAWGEAGLDYHYDNSPRDVQRAVFAEQIRLASATNKPLVVHAREADDDTYDALVAAALPDGYPIHLHCFTGAWPFAERMLQRFSGLRIGLTGCCTFKNARNLHEVARRIDLARLLLETDAPFMAPMPHRGDIAHPGHVPTIAKAIAAHRADGTTTEDVLRRCLQNTKEIYRCF